MRPAYTTHPRPLAFGHRGASLEAPENTMPAFQRALEVGVDALEIDIHPSSDDVPMIFHDPTLDRVTGRPGFIRALSARQLGTLDAGATFTRDGGRTFPWRERGVGIPTLAQLFEQAGQVRINIDFKDTSPAMEDEVERLVRRHRAEDRVLVCSSDEKIAHRVRARFPGWPTSASQGEITRLVLLGWLGLGRLVVPQVCALQIPPRYGIFPVATPRLIRLAQARGLDVHVWTLNDPAKMRRYLKWGVDGVMSDDPATLVNLMKSMGLR